MTDSSNQSFVNHIIAKSIAIWVEFSLSDKSLVDIKNREQQLDELRVWGNNVLKHRNVRGGTP